MAKENPTVVLQIKDSPYPMEVIQMIEKEAAAKGYPEGSPLDLSFRYFHLKQVADAVDAEMKRLKEGLGGPGSSYPILDYGYEVVVSNGRASSSCDFHGMFHFVEDPKVRETLLKGASISKEALKDIPGGEVLVGKFFYAGARGSPIVSVKTLTKNKLSEYIKAAEEAKLSTPSGS